MNLVLNQSSNSTDFQIVLYFISASKSVLFEDPLYMQNKRRMTLFNSLTHCERSTLFARSCFLELKRGYKRRMRCPIYTLITPTEGKKITTFLL